MNLELSYCDGTNPIVFGSRFCSIPISILRAEPHNLPWGTDVNVNVYAENAYGFGPPAVASGGIINTYPEPPVLSQLFPPPSMTAITVTWTMPNDGGAEILDTHLE